MIKIKRTPFYAALLAAGLFSCTEDDGPVTIPPTESAVMDPSVGGPNQPNQVFVDLSTEIQTSVARNHWDLAFYTGSEFRVLLNNSTSALADELAKTDLTAVSAEDTTGWDARLDIDAIFGTLFGPQRPEWLPEAATWMDDPSGDLSTTAIASIKSNADDNPVYIINRGKNPDGSQRGWKKVKITRNGSAYVLQHANIGAESFEQLTIQKNADSDFVYVSFEDGIVSVAPSKTEWDMVFTVFTNLLPIDASTRIPYAYKDYILTNAGRVEVAQVQAEGDVTYEGFSHAQISTVSFKSQVSAIGSGWRVVAQPGSDQQTGVKEDVFYIIKDTESNYYKLRFTRLVDPVSGERGHPQFQYQLLVP
ncbi:HmuY family protein [Roseivirga sp. UBA1976]|uniref:HmuY family protein n=1 Tax=Roseivirga sp. UBA1976 TaxID=1947386 RepID=UPI0025810DE8|nr:HmuY family protein [Roseivirga sp. UBA1976]MEC7753622.1 HmuY family protein [Bacteroidota bacterium]|tara:strand:- start:5875 stop:6963 length:1089 start_codon:yes stop_codon:yes gene_type:complete